MTARLLPALALAGCLASTSDDASDDTPCDTTGAALVVGTFDGAAVQPWGDERPVQLVHGPQGTWHVTADLETSNTPQRVSIRSVLTLEDGDTFGDVTTDLQLLPASGTTWTCDGVYDDIEWRFDLRDIAPGEGDAAWKVTCDRPIVLTTTLSADGTVLATNTATITFTPWPADVEAHGACAGDSGDTGDSGTTAAP